MKKRKNEGFSLLELIIVIAMMAVIGGILIGAFGNIGAYQVKEYTEVLDSFMKKTKTEAMTKNNVCGFCLYQKEECYYVESYGENVLAGGTVEYSTVEAKKLGSSQGMEIAVSKKDGTNKKVLTNNMGSGIDTCVRVKYASGTGKIADITMDGSTQLDKNDIKFTISKGENLRCIEINPVTGNPEHN